MPRLENKIAIVDIETTGPNIDDGDRIIQIGAIIISEGNIVNTYSMLINPSRDIPEHIAKLTGISEEDVANAPQFNSVATLWYERLKDCVFVAHNLGFDLRILKESFERFDLEFDPVALDSVVLSKILVPTAIGFNLTDLSHHFNFEYNEAHDALSDALITADILSKLAELALEIPQETFNRMEPFLDHLRHDEMEFFINPQKFMVKEELNDRRVVTESQPSLQSDAKTNKTLSEYISEEWKNHPYLIVEDTKRPIPYEMIYNDIVLSENTYLLTFPSLDESNYWIDIIKGTHLKDIALLKSQGNYLHEKAFEQYISNYNFKRDNQQELLVIAAAINWQSQSEYGDFSEINKELSVKTLLEKNQAHNLRVASHRNYHAASTHAKQAKVIITYDANLQSIVQANREKNDYLFHRRLVIADINSFIDSARYIHQCNIQISALSTMLMNLSDEMYQFYSNNQIAMDLNGSIQSIRDTIKNTINIVSSILKDVEVDKIQQQEGVSTYIELESNDAKNIMSYLKEISIKLIDLHNQVSLESDKLKLIQHSILTLQRYIDELAKLNGVQNKDHFMTIDATRINNKFYNISIQVKPIIIQEGYTRWLKEMKQVLMVSSGNYYNHRMTGNSTWIKLDSMFHYLKLPSLYTHHKHIVKHPVEFIQADEDSERISDLAEYLKSDKEQMANKIIIVMPNQTLVTNLFHKIIQTPELSNDYHIFAQSITGSLNRIRRRIFEAEKMIVILKERSFTQLLWGDQDADVSLILYNLPFQSPKETQVQAKFHYLKQVNPNAELFDDLLLPQMIQRIKNVVNFIGRHYVHSSLYVLDKRLYTKYYTKDILEGLESMIEFQIIN